MLHFSQRLPPMGTLANYNWHDWLRVEVKGAELRRFRLALWFMSQALSILEQNDCRIISRIYVKSVGEEFDGTSVYASAIQRIVAAFENYVGERSEKASPYSTAETKTKTLHSPIRFSHGTSAHTGMSTTTLQSCRSLVTARAMQ